MILPYFYFLSCRSKKQVLVSFKAKIKIQSKLFESSAFAELVFFCEIFKEFYLELQIFLTNCWLSFG